MIKYKLVDVSAIEVPPVPPTRSSQEIEYCADLYLNSGVMTSPLILKEFKPNSFRVIHGFEEYYVALRAKQKDLDKAEMVNAFVLDLKATTQEEEAILAQVQHTINFPIIDEPDGKPKPNETNVVSLDLKEFSQALQVIQSQNSQMLKIFEAQRKEFLQRIEQVEQRVKTVFDQVLPPKTKFSRPETGKNLEQSLSELIGKIVTGELQINIIISNNQLHVAKQPTSESKRSQSSSTKLPNIENLTVAQLKENLKKYGIKFDSKANKSELVKILKKYYRDQEDKIEFSTERTFQKSVGLPITSYEAFVEESMKTLTKLNTDYQCDNLVPIYRLRRALDDRVDRTQFNEWLLEMHAQSLLELMSGSMPDLTPDKVEDSVKSRLGSVYYSISLDQ